MLFKFRALILALRKKRRKRKRRRRRRLILVQINQSTNHKRIKNLLAIF